MLNPPHCPAGFFFFVFICAHLFSFIVSLYGFASVVLILLFCSYYFCDGYENWSCLRATGLLFDCVQFVFIASINPGVSCYAGFVSFLLWRNQLFRVLVS